MTDRRALAMDVVSALVKMLPADGAEFPIEDRVQWLRAMAAALCLAYGLHANFTIEPKMD